LIIGTSQPERRDIASALNTGAGLGRRGAALLRRDDEALCVVSVRVVIDIRVQLEIHCEQHPMMRLLAWRERRSVIAC
jgi:hypothetical protein